ncbi:hypothetical protein PV326_010125 [Microctonus aethiopoides]|nr:hypothetical protein PV326_010125 [Microctonus aethiopoides]
MVVVLIDNDNDDEDEDKAEDDDDIYVSSSRRELSGVKELVNTRRVQKNRHPSATLSRDGSTTGCGGGGGGGGLLGGCSGGSDALAELTIEDLAAIPSGNHGSSHHTGHPSHHKIGFKCGEIY